MKLLKDLTELRKKTIYFWANYTHPGTEVDIQRVYAFRELNPETATNADVSKAYGGDGWAPQTPCTECGADAVMEVGKTCLCSNCLTTAYNQINKSTPISKTGFFTNLFKG